MKANEFFDSEEAKKLYLKKEKEALREFARLNKKADSDFFNLIAKAIKNILKIK